MIIITSHAQSRRYTGIRIFRSLVNGNPRPFKSKLTPRYEFVMQIERGWSGNVTRDEETSDAVTRWPAQING